MASHRIEEHETDLPPDLLEQGTRQRSARNDPSMRDGNSSHGNPYESDPEEFSSDSDVGDTVEEAVGASEEVGVLDAVPSNQAGVEIPDAQPPAHAGLDATDEVDDSIDERGTAESPDTGKPDEDGEEFAATVGTNRPAGDREQPPSDAGIAPRTGSPQDRADADTRGAPFEGYDELTVKEVVARLDTLSPEELNRVRDFEASHRRRKTLLTQLERRLQGDGSRKRSTSRKTNPAPSTSGGEPNP